MNRIFLILAALFLAASFAVPATKQSGTITSHTSIACGSKKENKKTNIDLMCQQYVVRAGSADYTVRQQKPSNQAFIPLNTPVEFTIDKNKMKFKAAGKSYEYLIIGHAAAGSTQP